MAEARYFGVQAPPLLTEVKQLGGMQAPDFGAAVMEALRTIFGPQFLTPRPTTGLTEEEWLDLATGGAPMLRFGVLPGREKLLSEMIRRGFREPLFHGARREAIPHILEHGFASNTVGSALGTRFGEPFGISLTRNPETARRFADDEILRVAANVPRSSVGTSADPAFVDLLRDAYLRSLAKTPAPAGYPSGVSMRDVFNQGRAPFLGSLEALSPTQIGQMNRFLSADLRRAGVEGILYNPRRYSEYELRVLNPKNAIPVGTIPSDLARENLPAFTSDLQDHANFLTRRIRHYLDHPQKTQGTNVVQDLLGELRRVEEELAVIQASPMVRYTPPKQEQLLNERMQAIGPVHLREIYGPLFK